MEATMIIPNKKNKNIERKLKRNSMEITKKAAEDICSSRIVLSFSSGLKVFDINILSESRGSESLSLCDSLDRDCNVSDEILEAFSDISDTFFLMFAVILLFFSPEFASRNLSGILGSPIIRAPKNEANLIIKSPNLVNISMEYLQQLIS